MLNAELVVRLRILRSVLDLLPADPQVCLALRPQQRRIAHFAEMVNHPSAANLRQGARGVG
jgi:hypothetical protein